MFRPMWSSSGVGKETAVLSIVAYVVNISSPLAALCVWVGGVYSVLLCVVLHALFWLFNKVNFCVKEL
jgi:hypothetical protein